MNSPFTSLSTVCVHMCTAWHLASSHFFSHFLTQNYIRMLKKIAGITQKKVSEFLPPPCSFMLLPLAVSHLYSRCRIRAHEFNNNVCYDQLLHPHCLLFWCSSGTFGLQLQSVFAFMKWHAAHIVSFCVSHHMRSKDVCTAGPALKVKRKFLYSSFWGCLKYCKTVLTGISHIYKPSSMLSWIFQNII